MNSICFMMLLQLDSKSSETPLKLVFDEAPFEKFAVISKRITSKASLSVNETQPDLIICRTFGVVDGTVACVRTDLGEIEKSKWSTDEHHFGNQTDSGWITFDMSESYNSNNNIPPDTSNLEDLEDVSCKLIEIRVTTKDIVATKQKYEQGYGTVKYLSKALIQESYFLYEDGKIHLRETKDGKLQAGSIIPSRVKWLSNLQGRPALLDEVRQRRIENDKKILSDHPNLNVGSIQLGTFSIISKS